MLCLWHFSVQVVDAASKVLIPCPEACAHILGRVASHMVPEACGATFQWSPLAAPLLNEFKHRVAQAQTLLLSHPSLGSSPLLTALAHATSNVCALALSMHMVNVRVLAMIMSELQSRRGAALSDPDSEQQAQVERQLVGALARDLWSSSPCPRGDGSSSGMLAGTSAHGPDSARGTGQARAECLTKAMQLLYPAAGE